MPIDSTTAIPNWTSLEGRLLEGGYEIEHCLLSAPSAASFKVRVLGDRFTNAIVNVFPDSTTTPEQYALWEEALQLHSPQLSAPMAVGKLEWDENSYSYVILRKADERLSSVLRERALSLEEARDLLRNVVEGLEYLHARGFVHSYLSPEEILAMGDSIQLSTTSIRRINSPVTVEDGESGAIYTAPESSGENATTAADVWCLGATIYESLTQRRLESDFQDKAETLPPPYNIMAYRCLEADPHVRCSLADVRAMLRGEQLHPIIKKPVPAEPPPPPPPIEESATVEPPAPVLPEEAKNTPQPEPVAAAATPAVEQPGVYAANGSSGAGSVHAPSAATAAVPVASSAASTPAASASHSGPAVAATATPASEPVKESAASPAPQRNSVPNRPRPNLPPSSNSGKSPTPPLSRSPEPRPRLAPSPKPVYTEQRLRHPLQLEEEPKQSLLKRPAVLALLGVLAAILLIWLAWPKSHKARPGTEPTVTQSGDSAGSTLKSGSTLPGSQSRVLGPETTTGAPGAAATAAKADGANASNAHGDVWHVVVYTFNKREDAEKKIAAINQKHPGFEPQVFSQSGGTPFLVVLGSGSSHEDAARLRQKARASGFPRDTYIQNFKH